MRPEKLQPQGELMTFQRWLTDQDARHDPVGDLARDVAMDRGAPNRDSTYRTWERYLRRQRACDGALIALREAWREYAAVAEGEKHADFHGV